MIISDFRKGDRLNLLLRQGQTKKKKRRSRLVFLGMVFLSLSFVVYFFSFQDQFISRSIEPIELASPPSDEPQVQGSPHQIIEGSIRKGSTFFQSLAEKDVPPRWIDLIVSKLRPYIDFRKIKGGSYRLIMDGKGELVKFTYEPDPAEVYEIGKDSQGYVAQRKEVALDTCLVKVEGEIRSSLFEAMDANGGDDQLAISFAEILAWEVDFYMDVKEGDRFKVIVEKLYKGDRFIRYGTIHAVEYQGGDHIVRGIEYQGHFYHEDGTSLRRAFLKAPLRFNRISSRFSRARRHPILGGVFPHYAVDYAAPPGTPVWAVADGVVIGCGWNEGYGKQVILRHMNGYRTYYGHLSRYGRGIKKGVRVQQKQIIGYVGSTGLSTGPHLDYRLTKNGRFRNPLRESFPSGIPIRKLEMETFQKRRDEVVAWLQGGVGESE